MNGLCSGIYRIFLLDTTLKSLVLFLVVGVLLLLRRRASSAERHSIWKFGLFSLLLLPLLSAFLPELRLAILPTVIAPPSVQEAILTQRRVENSPGIPSEIVHHAMPSTSNTVVDRNILLPASPTQLSPAQPTRTVAGSYHEPLTPLTTTPTPSRMWRGGSITLLCLIWLSVCSVLMLALLHDLLKLTRLRRQSTPLREDSLTVLAEGLAQELGVKRDFVLYAAPNVMPMAWGWLHPVILLPTGTETWPVARLRMVLLHELGHIRRNDWLTQRLARAVCALYWFNPLVWLALRAIRRESECACDDLVLSTGVEAPDYAQQLLEVIRIMKHQRPVSHATVTMAQSTHIRSRLSAILDPNRSRGGFSRHGLALSLCCLVGLIPLSMTRVIAQQNSSPTSHTSPAPSAQSQSDAGSHVTAQAGASSHKTSSKATSTGSDYAAIITGLQNETEALKTLSSELKKSASDSNLPADRKQKLAQQQEHVLEQLRKIRAHLASLKTQQKRLVADERSLHELAQKQAALSILQQRTAELQIRSALVQQQKSATEFQAAKAKLDAL